VKAPIDTSQNGLTTLKVLRDFGFEVSWAGANPWAPGLCLGTEDGKVAFVKNDDTQPPDFWPVSDSEEAVNGVAFVDSLMAVSTRSEVTFLNVSNLNRGKVIEKRVFPSGAHGVIATPNGRILAPLGTTGLMCMVANERKTRPINIHKGDDEQYLYKIAALSTQSQTDVIVAAARRSGLITLLLKPEHGNIGSSRRLPDMDVVDVCPIGQQHPFGAIALGSDGSIYAIENVLRKARFRTLRFDSIQGRAYRILCSKDHLFMLTSEMLYAFPNTVSRILSGHQGRRPTKVRGIPLEAVDANLVDDEWISIVMPNHVYLAEIQKLVEGGFESVGGSPTSRIESLEMEMEASSVWHSTPFDMARPT
jgi:hypothetical protein